MKKIILFLLLNLFNLTVFAQKTEAIYKQAVQYHQEGNYSEAIKMYTKVIKKDSMDSYAFLNRALCYYSLNKYDNMLSDYEHALRLNPKDTVILEHIADGYSIVNNYASAIQYYKRTLSMGKTPNYSIYGSMGTCYYFSGQNDSARKYLQMSYDLNQTYVLVLNNLAWANLDYNPNKSCMLFNKAYMMDSLEVRNINNLGYSHLLCGNLDKGFELISRAEKLDPTNSFVYRNYGLYYMKKGDKIQACKNLQKAIDLKIIEEWGEGYVSELMMYCNKK